MAKSTGSIASCVGDTAHPSFNNSLQPPASLAAASDVEFPGRRAAAVTLQDGKTGDLSFVEQLLVAHNSSWS